MVYPYVTKPGAMVISLDFELFWGMRDLYGPDDPYLVRVINARKIISRILDLFEEYGIAATWAVVGFLFAESHSDLQQYSPKIRPQYTRSSLNPYLENTGEGEWDDPLHYAHQLIRHIQKRNRQEIGTHTFSHYYCLEEGQTRETFAADLNSALAIANKYGLQIKSIVFPRNQYNPNYDDILLRQGITCYRGNEQHPIYQETKHKTYNYPYKRLYRLLDSYVNLSGLHLTSWEEVVNDSGLCNISSSRYLRNIKKSFPILHNLKRQRIITAMEQAASSKKIFHLWTHPHDFGISADKNLQDLKTILDHFKVCQEKHGMVSLNMAEAANMATLI